MSSAATTTNAESVASCRRPTPLLLSPPPAGDALPRLPVRRRLDLPAAAGGLDDDDDFLCRAAEEMERSLNTAKRHAPQGPATPPPMARPAFREKQCICGRGPCDVVREERGGRWGWAYVCSAPPKCTLFAWCEESDPNPNSQPAFRSHPEPSNPRVFYTPSNHRDVTTTPVNVSPQGGGTTTPVTQGARSNDNWPICKCTAGKCRKLTIKGADYYVCHIRKGQGACPYRVPVKAAAEEPLQNGDNNPRENKHLEYNPVKKKANEHNLVIMGENNESGPVNPDQPEDDEYPFDIVDDDIVPNGRLAPAHPTPYAVATCKTPSMLHKPIAMVELETPTKSSMPPNGTTSPITPQSNCCFRCGEEGHWYKNCPKPPQPCYRCGEVGHRSRDCPKLWARLPVRRGLDFPAASGGLDDDEDFLCRAAEEMERSLHEAKCRASPGPAPPPLMAPLAFREKQCICGRGLCNVVWEERGGRWGWAYVCLALPKCTLFAWCEESDLNPNSQPAFRSHPEPSNPHVFYTPSSHMAGTTTPVNVNPQGAGTTSPVTQGARPNDNWPICKCTAGKCRKLTIKDAEYYVCPIRQGQGACSYRVLVDAAAEKPQQNGDNNPRDNKHLEYNPVKKEATGHNLVNMGAMKMDQSILINLDDECPVDIVDDDIVPNGRLAPAHPTPFAVAACKTPSVLHKPIAMVELETPTKSPMPPNGTTSPITPQSSRCFRCGEGGHWYKNCPRPPRPCYRCGEVGHRSSDCPKLSPHLDTCFHCGQVGHWKIDCPVLRDKRGF